uniref:ERO1-like protein alpha n=1 Tax=Xiphophorus couchianus TaxID=32473 RepID=A0A3B5MBI0_9TELE
ISLIWVHLIKIKFPQVTGELDDCTCDVETIDSFNNEQIFPKLQPLLESHYFRFYKVNLNKPCPFWTADSHCGLRDCAVKPCSPNEVPEGIRSVPHDKVREFKVNTLHTSQN